MKSYCVKEKRETECVPGTEQTKTARNGRRMMQCKCASCGITKTKFIASSRQTKPYPSWPDQSYEPALFKRLGDQDRRYKQLMRRARQSSRKGPDPDEQFLRLIAGPEPNRRYKQLMKRAGLEEYPSWPDRSSEPALFKRLGDQDRRYKQLMKRVRPDPDPDPDEQFQQLMERRFGPMKRTKMTKKRLDPKAWKHTTGMTQAAIQKRLDEFFGPVNQTKMNKAIKFADDLSKSPIGTEKKIGLFTVEKTSDLDYSIKYWYRWDKSSEPIEQDLIAGVDYQRLVDFVYQHEFGIWEFLDDYPTSITQPLFLQRQ